jgi:hypothetical protein
MHIHNRLFATLSLSLVIMTGCGPDPNIGQVSGTVTYKGAPVEGATVSFLPTSGEGVLAVGNTDAAGHYVLAAPVQKRGKGVTAGAFSGTYNVAIRKLEVTLSKADQLYQEGKITYDELQSRGGGGGGTTRDLLPLKYRDAKTSGLEADVKAKTDNVFDFEIVD